VLALAATFMEDCVMDVCVVSGNGEEAMKATACASLGAFAAVCQLKGAAPNADWELMTDCGEFRGVVFTANTRHSQVTTIGVTRCKWCYMGHPSSDLVRLLLVTRSIW
jgi:hypothetical protein